MVIFIKESKFSAYQYNYFAMWIDYSNICIRIAKTLPRDFFPLLILHNWFNLDWIYPNIFHTKTWYSFCVDRLSWGRNTTWYTSSSRNGKVDFSTLKLRAQLIFCLIIKEYFFSLKLTQYILTNNFLFNKDQSYKVRSIIKFKPSN